MKNLGVPDVAPGGHNAEDIKTEEKRYSQDNGLPVISKKTQTTGVSCNQIP